MTNQITWSEHNDQFLSAALNWLRLRLEEYIEQGARPAPPSPPPAGPASSAGSLFGWMETGVEEPAAPIVETGVTRAARAMEEAATDPSPALILLADRLGLSRFEREVLLLCAAMELDTRIPALCARAQGDPNRPYPTFALALALFDEPAWDVLSPERPLRHWRLIEINQPGAQPLTASPLRADERIVNYLKGLNYLDDRLAPLLVPFDGAADPGRSAALPASGRGSGCASSAARQPRAGRRPSVQLLGLDSFSKQLVAWHAAAALGLQLYRLPAELLPAQAAELETWPACGSARACSCRWPSTWTPTRLDARGQAERPGAAAAPLSGPRPRPVLPRHAARSGPAWARRLSAVDVDKPTPAEQQEAWDDCSGSAWHPTAPPCWPASST